MTFLVDLDGTLKTGVHFDGDLSIEIDGKKWSFAKRPHCEEFLEGLREMGDVHLCTASRRRYAKLILEKTRLEGYFDRIFTAESYAAGLPAFKDYLIIEDEEELGILKLKTMAGNRNATDAELKAHIVLVPKYDGRARDSGLLAALDECRSRVA